MALVSVAWGRHRRTVLGRRVSARRCAAARSVTLSRRGELEVELVEPAEHPRRRVRSSGGRPAGRGGPRRSGCLASGRAAAGSRRWPRPGPAVRPAQVWIPWPKAMCWRPLGRSSRSSSGSSNSRGSRLAAPGSTITVLPAGISVPPMAVGTRREPEGPLDGALEAEHLLDEHRNEGSVAPGAAAGARDGHRGSAPTMPRSRAVVSWPAAKRLAAMRMTSSTGGSVPSGKVAVARPVMTSCWGLRRRSSM